MLNKMVFKNHSFNGQKQRFKKLLDNNNIPYEEIDYKDQRFSEHPSMKKELSTI